MSITEPILKPDFQSRRRHFIFSDDHERLRESIRAFVDREIVPHVEEWEETTFPDSIVRRMGDLGLLGLSVPEEYGGQGGDYFTNIVLAEEIARGGSGGLLMGLSVHTDMVIPPILKFGTEEQKRHWVTVGAAGRQVFCLAMTEPDAGSDLAGTSTRAVRDGDGWVINGSKTFITNGHRAGMVMLLTRTDSSAGHEGFTVFLVPMDTAGVIREKRLVKMGMHASDTALLAFQDVRVPGSAVLGEVGKGFYHIMWELQAERLIGAAGCLAYGQYAFDRALQYAQERAAFGRPIGTFQAVRQRLADAYTDVEAVRLTMWQAAWQLTAGQPAGTAIATAKFWAADAGHRVAHTAVHIHGGVGIDMDGEIHRYFAAAKHNEFALGGATAQLRRIGAALASS